MLRTAAIFSLLTLLAYPVSIARQASAQKPSGSRSFATPESADSTDETLEASVLIAPEVSAESRKEGSSPIEELPALKPESNSDKQDELLDAIKASHPWARFDPGAWRREVVVSEVFDETGAFAGRSTSEVTKRLIALDETTYTLSIESVVELGGRRTPAPVETTRFSFLLDRPIDIAVQVVTEGEPSSISLGEEVASAQTWIVKTESEGRTETETLYLAEGTTPAVLRRQRETSVAGEPGRRMTESVNRTNVPTLFNDELSATWQVVKRIHFPEGSQTEVFSIHSEDLPGGLFEEAVTEHDPQGHRRSWAVTRVIALGRTPAEQIEPNATLDAAPGVTIEVRPRRFLRMLRQGEQDVEEP